MLATILLLTASASLATLPLVEKLGRRRVPRLSRPRAPRRP